MTTSSASFDPDDLVTRAFRIKEARNRARDTDSADKLCLVLARAIHRGKSSVNVSRRCLGPWPDARCRTLVEAGYTVTMCRPFIGRRYVHIKLPTV
jgi:hypothetical protein